jgi:hypothetical protein
MVSYFSAPQNTQFSVHVYHTLDHVFTTKNHTVAASFLQKPLQKHASPTRFPSPKNFRHQLRKIHLLA